MSLTPPPVHVNEAVGLVREAAFGAGGTPTVFYHPISNQLKRRPNRQAMAGATGGMSRFRYIFPTGSRVFEGMTDISGPQSYHAEFDDIGHWFSAMFGVSTPDDDAPVVGAHTHVWTVPRTLPTTTPKSLALARIGGDEDTLLKGVLPNRMTLRGSQEGIVMYTVDNIGQSGGDAEVVDAVGSLSTAPWMEFMDCQLRWNTAAGILTGGLTNQTGAKSIRSWEIVFDNALRVEQAAGDGQRGPREFTYTGPRPVTMTVERDNADDQFFNDMFGIDPEQWFNSVELKITSPQFITGTTPFSLQIYSGAALLLGEPSEFAAPGVIPETLSWEFADDGTNPIATITLINGSDPTPTNPYDV